MPSGFHATICSKFPSSFDIKGFYLSFSIFFNSSDGVLSVRNLPALAGAAGTGRSGEIGSSEKKLPFISFCEITSDCTIYAIMIQLNAINRPETRLSYKKIFTQNHTHCCIAGPKATRRPDPGYGPLDPQRNRVLRRHDGSYPPRRCSKVHLRNRAAHATPGTAAGAVRGPRSRAPGPRCPRPPSLGHL